MKKIIVLAILALLGSGMACAQHQHGHGCGNCPNHGKHHPQQAQQAQVNADGIDMTIVRAFPTAKSIQKGKQLTEVYDAGKKLLGYVLYSKPASDGIKGYAGETPVMIALSAKRVILGVYLLPCRETPGYAKRVEDAGFYKNWNGLTVKKALKKEVDAVSGATFTSMAVAKSVRAALETIK